MSDVLQNLSSVRSTTKSANSAYVYIHVHICIKPRKIGIYDLKADTELGVKNFIDIVKTRYIDLSNR